MRYQQQVLVAPALIVAALVLLITPVHAGSGTSPAQPTPSSLWAAPATGSAVSFVQEGRTDIAIATVDGRTRFTGVCHDCGVPMTFKPEDSSKKCWVCDCGVSAASCISTKTLKHSSWNDLLQALAPGTGLRVTYNTADDPKSGISTLTIDKRSVLLPSDGPGTLDAAKLQTIAEPLGATRSELRSNGKQIVLALTEDWTDQKEASLEKKLAEYGVHVTRSGGGG